MHTIALLWPPLVVKKVYNSLRLCHLDMPLEGEFHLGSGSLAFPTGVHLATIAQTPGQSRRWSVVRLAVMVRKLHIPMMFDRMLDSWKPNCRVLHGFAQFGG